MAPFRQPALNIKVDEIESRLRTLEGRQNRAPPQVQNHEKATLDSLERSSTALRAEQKALKNTQNSLVARNVKLESTLNDVAIELDNLQYAILNCEAKLLGKGE
jgi:chromosome segregation ATPase